MKKYVILFIALGIGSAHAQERLLSFEQAVQMTLSDNLQLKASDYEEEAAIKERKAAYGLRLPQINAIGAYSYLGEDIAVDMNGLKQPVGGILQGLGSSGSIPPAVLQQAQGLLAQNWTIPIQDRSFGLAGGTVTYPIYTGGKINAANNAAKIKVEETEASRNQSEGALISELTERYYGLSLSLQVVEVRKQVLEGMKLHLSDAIALEKNGIIARGERLYAEVYTAEAERDLMKANKQVETLQSALGNTLNSPERSFVPVTSLFVLHEIEPVSYFKNLAPSLNPILKQVDLKYDLAKENMRLHRAEFAPQVALMGAGTFYNYQVNPLIPRWAVGAGVSFKIFNGLNREYKYSAARTQMKQVEIMGVKANQNILTLIDKLYNEMTSYQQELPSIDASQTFAEEYLRIKTEAFKEGIVPSSDVVDAQLNLARIKIERLQAAYYYDLMLARLLEACGMSETLPSYSQRASAVPIRFEHKVK